MITGSASAGTSLQRSRRGETKDRSRPPSVRRAERGFRFKSLQDFKPILDILEPMQTPGTGRSGVRYHQCQDPQGRGSPHAPHGAWRLPRLVGREETHARWPVPGVLGTDPPNPPQQGHPITLAAEGPSQPPPTLSPPGRQGQAPAEADMASPLPPHGSAPQIFAPKRGLMNDNRGGGGSSEVGCSSTGYKDTYNSPRRGDLYQNREKGGGKGCGGEFLRGFSFTERAGREVQRPAAALAQPGCWEGGAPTSPELRSLARGLLPTPSGGKRVPALEEATLTARGRKTKPRSAPGNASQWMFETVALRRLVRPRLCCSRQRSLDLNSLESPWRKGGRGGTSRGLLPRQRGRSFARAPYNCGEKTQEQLRCWKSNRSCWAERIRCEERLRPARLSFKQKEGNAENKVCCKDKLQQGGFQASRGLPKEQRKERVLRN